VERAVEEVKQKPKLFLARYIRDVLLWRSSEEERVRLMYRAAVPLLLHAIFGPVPEGVTYITQAKDEVVFYQPEEIEKFTKPQWDLLRAGLQPIAKWLAQKHEDLVEETLRDLAGINGEEARKPYKEALKDLLEALDWARDEMLKEGSKILAELGVPEEGRVSAMALLAFVIRRLAAVFKSNEIRRCWQRAALIVGHALAGFPVLPRREWLPEDVAEALGDALEPCAVDAYSTIDGVMSPLLLGVAQLMPIRELNILSPFADTETIDAARKTAEELMKRWKRRGLYDHEAFYALGLATLAAGAEVDRKTADLWLYATPFAVQRVTHPGTVLPVLAALRSLGEKAPHRYVVALAAASELETLDPEIVWYIYDALQQLKNRLQETLKDCLQKTERLWPLVEAVHAYSNLLKKHSVYIMDRWGDAVADMCELYGEIRKHDGTTAPESGLSAQRLLNAVARAYVLVVALLSDILAPLVQDRCGLGDLVEEAKTVRNVLDEVAAHPDELRKIMESAEWVVARSVTEDAGGMVENLRSWFTHVLARYKLNHALDEKGELDEKKLKEVAEEFEKAAEMRIKLKDWGGYLAARGLALGARVLAAKNLKELLERAKGFWELWGEAEKHPELTARYLVTAADRLGDYLLYLAVSGDRERAEELLKERRWLLNYDREVSVATRLMLKLFDVGEGAKLKEVVDTFEPQLSPEFRPALLMLAGRLQRDKALEECAKFIPPSSAGLYVVLRSIKTKAELCVDAIAAVANNQVAAKILRLNIEMNVPKAHPLLEIADGKTLVEVLTSISSTARLVFMLLAAVEGRANAVRLHGLWGSAAYKGTVLQPLFRAVYENCVDLNSEGCRMALLKLYYLHY
jgi:hypothetical protein